MSHIKKFSVGRLTLDMGKVGWQIEGGPERTFLKHNEKNRKKTSSLS